MRVSNRQLLACVIAGAATVMGACNEAPLSPTLAGFDAGPTGVVDRRVSQVSVEPSPIDFGRVAAGGYAESRITLTNTGPGPLVVTDLFVAGGEGRFSIPAAYQVRYPEAIALPPGRAHELTIVYEPADGRQDAAGLVVQWVDGELADRMIRVEIVGNRAAPCIEVTPNDDGMHVVDTHTVGRVSRTRFTIRNCSARFAPKLLVVTSVGLRDDSSGAYALADLPEFPLELAPREGRAFTVEFSPTTDRRIETGTLEIESDDPYAPVLAIDLTGVGTTNECPVARGTCAVEGSGEAPGVDIVARPLDTVTCSATDSTDADGEVFGYLWTVVERPDGSTAVFPLGDSEPPRVVVDLAGRYVFDVEVVDDRGCVSDPATVAVEARPREELYIDLVWHTPGDPDSSDTGASAGSDLDLHLLHPGACWENETLDCHFGAPGPNWGASDSTEDDPMLLFDDNDGWGPETIVLGRPELDRTYKVGVHCFDDHDFGVNLATVRIFVMGELLFEARDQELPHTGFWWEVAAIHWPSAQVTPIDLVYEDVPPCP